MVSKCVELFKLLDTMITFGRNILNLSLGMLGDNDSMCSASFSPKNSSEKMRICVRREVLTLEISLIASS